MICQLPTLIRMVRTAMALNKSDRPLVRCRDPDTADLDDMIAQCIVPAAVRVFSDAPPDDLSQAVRDMGTDAIYWHSPVDGTYSGHVYLPDDFLRLAAFEMSDWSRPVVTPITDDSPRRSVFFSRYAALSGSPECPQCLISRTAESHSLTFRSCHTDTAHIVHASYIPYPRIDHGGIDLPGRLLHPIISHIASVLSSLPNNM